MNHKLLCIHHIAVEHETTPSTYEQAVVSTLLLRSSGVAPRTHCPLHHKAIRVPFDGAGGFACSIEHFTHTVQRMDGQHYDSGRTILITVASTSIYQGQHGSGVAMRCWLYYYWCYDHQWGMRSRLFFNCSTSPAPIFAVIFTTRRLYR